MTKIESNRQRDLRKERQTKTVREKELYQCPFRGHHLPEPREETSLMAEAPR